MNPASLRDPTLYKIKCPECSVNYQTVWDRARSENGLMVYRALIPAHSWVNSRNIGMCPGSDVQIVVDTERRQEKLI